MIFAFGDSLQIESVNGAHGVYGLGAQKLATEEDEPELVVKQDMKNVEVTVLVVIRTRKVVTPNAAKVNMLILHSIKSN